MSYYLSNIGNLFYANVDKLLENSNKKARFKEVTFIYFILYSPKYTSKKNI